ncbi:hypothetical protein [Flavobacterium sp.]|uniref:hypothetical protein n=1 Tax=Flavobacterium sp. TaxID=239 RepID=UPI0026106570|nr:hypothetical protein [Flavobacterium sp.]
MSSTIITDLKIRYFWKEGNPVFCPFMETYESNVIPHTPKWSSRIVGYYEDLCQFFASIIGGIHNGNYHTKGDASEATVMDWLIEACKNAKEISSESCTQISFAPIYQAEPTEVQNLMETHLGADLIATAQVQNMNYLFSGPVENMFPIFYKIRKLKAFENYFRISHIDEEVVFSSKPNPLVSDCESFLLKIDVPQLEFAKLKQKRYQCWPIFISKVDQNTFFDKMPADLYFQYIFPKVAVSEGVYVAKKNLLAFLELNKHVLTAAPEENYHFVFQGTMPHGDWGARLAIDDDSPEEDIELVSSLSGLQLFGSIRLPYKFPVGKQIGLF